LCNVPLFLSTPLVFAVKEPNLFAPCSFFPCLSVDGPSTSGVPLFGFLAQLTGLFLPDHQPFPTSPFGSVSALALAFLGFHPFPMDFFPAASLFGTIVNKPSSAGFDFPPELRNFSSFHFPTPFTHLERGFFRMPTWNLAFFLNPGVFSLPAPPRPDDVDHDFSCLSFFLIGHGVPRVPLLLFHFCFLGSHFCFSPPLYLPFGPLFGVQSIPPKPFTPCPNIVFLTRIFHCPTRLGPPVLPICSGPTSETFLTLSNTFCFPSR